MTNIIEKSLSCVPQPESIIRIMSLSQRYANEDQFPPSFGLVWFVVFLGKPSVLTQIISPHYAAGWSQIHPRGHMEYIPPWGEFQ